MALTVGTNSWVTLAEAETYFSERIDSTPWSSLADNATKEKYLISAYRWIIYDPMFSVPSTSSSDAVKFGQCEAAIFLISYSKEYDKRQALIASGVKEFVYSRWEEKLGEAVKPLSVINYFTSGGYYRGGVSVTVFEDNSTTT